MEQNINDGDNMIANFFRNIFRKNSNEPSNNFNEVDDLILDLDNKTEEIKKQEEENTMNLPVVNLYRLTRSDQGTRGKLYYDDFSCHTLELPWRNNQRNISCVPPDIYKCTTRISPKFGLTYWLLEVPNRTYILIHSGNWAGDVNKGFKTHVNGCILLGLSTGFLQGQWAVLNSRITVTKFMDIMDQQPFTLVIHDSMI